MASTIEEILSLFRQRYINLGDSTEGKLLMGVARAIGDRGASETTVQDILDAAGLSRRTFYQFFQNKEDALDALFARVSAGMLSAVENLVADEDDPTEAALKICELYLSLQLATGKGALAVHAEATRPESRLFARREAVLDRMSQLIAARVEAARGEAVDPLLVRAVLLGVEGAVVHLKRRGEFDDSAPPRIKALTRAMIGNLGAKT
jgi:AcrR family transcriptional regulator